MVVLVVILRQMSVLLFLCFVMRMMLYDVVIGELVILKFGVGLLQLVSLIWKCSLFVVVFYLVMMLVMLQVMRRLLVSSGVVFGFLLCLCVVKEIFIFVVGRFLFYSSLLVLRVQVVVILLLLCCVKMKMCLLLFMGEECLSLILCDYFFFREMLDQLMVSDVELL